MKFVGLLLASRVESQFGRFSFGPTDPPLPPEHPDAVRDDTYARNFRFDHAFQGQVGAHHKMPKGITGSCNSDMFLSNVGAMSKFATPGFEGRNYPNDANCEYTIETEPSLRIKLTTLWMDVEPGPPSCPFDYVEVFDGVNATEPTEERFCGLDLPSPIYSETNFIRIKFISDDADARKGAAFKAEVHDPADIKKAFKCDFENKGLNGLKIIQGKEYLKLHKGHTAIAGAGPFFDHTYKKPKEGRYLLFNAHDTVRQNETVVIFETPLIHINKRTTDPFCVQFAMGNRGAGVGTVETKAIYYNNMNVEKSSKVLDTQKGEVRVTDSKMNPWHLKQLSAPSWDHRMKIRWTITHRVTEARAAYATRGHIVFDDIMIDEGLCKSGLQYCPRPLRPKKKTLYKEVFTGKWNCFNSRFPGRKYNMTDPAVLLPLGTVCTVKCNLYKEMADKLEHGVIYCGSRGWYSKANDEHVLNELPTLPGESPNGSKKDPDMFNLMPVCRTIRCAIPPAPSNAEFWGCDNSETLTYLPFQSKCELRCKPGFKKPEKEFSTCGQGGKVQGYERQSCVQLPDEDITDDMKALIDQIRPLELLLTEPSEDVVATTSKVFLPLTSAPPQTGTTPSAKRAMFTAAEGIRTANTPAPTAPGTGNLLPTILPQPTLATAPIPMDIDLPSRAPITTKPTTSTTTTVATPTVAIPEPPAPTPAVKSTTTTATKVSPATPPAETPPPPPASEAPVEDYEPDNTVIESEPFDPLSTKAPSAKPTAPPATMPTKATEVITPPREETTILTSPNNIEPTTEVPKKKDNKADKKKEKPEKEANQKAASSLTHLSIALLAIIILF